MRQYHYKPLVPEDIPGRPRALAEVGLAGRLLDINSFDNISPDVIGAARQTLRSGPTFSRR